jgi:hypothetical protein
VENSWELLYLSIGGSRIYYFLRLFVPAEKNRPPDKGKGQEE